MKNTISILFFRLSFLLLIFPIITTSCNNSAPETKSLNDDISQNKTLEAHTSYKISKSIKIDANTTLKVDKGVSISICDTCQLICSGNIIAEGDIENNINIYGDSLLKGAIRFENTSQASRLQNVTFFNTAITLNKSDISIDSCNFHISKLSKNNTFFIYCENSSVQISKSNFYGNKTNEGIGFNHGECFVNNTFFDQIPDAIELSNVNGSKILSNVILNSSDDAIDLNNCRNILIENNNIRYSKDKAISIGNKKDITLKDAALIKNNILFGNKIGISIKGGGQAIVSRSIIENNNLGINVQKSEKQLLEFKLTLDSTSFIKNKTNFQEKAEEKLLFKNCFIDNVFKGQEEGSLNQRTLHKQIMNSIPSFE